MEGGWAVGEAEEHDKGFEEALIHLEGHLPLVSLLCSYVVVSPAYIQHHEVDIPCKDVRVPQVCLFYYMCMHGMNEIQVHANN